MVKEYRKDEKRVRGKKLWMEERWRRIETWPARVGGG